MIATVQNKLDEIYNPLRVFASPSKIASQDGANDDSDQRMVQSDPMNLGMTSAQATTVHLIPFDPEQMIQDCDDFSISSCEAQIFLDDDFEYVSSNAEAFWEQGVKAVVVTAPTLDRQHSVSNVSLSSADCNIQTSNSQESMEIS